MTHGSLFSGIGGFDLAAEWMGWENVFHCEWDEFCQKILKHYWPNAKSYGDITKTDFSEWRGRIDIVSGGFPCQPYSTAGKRKGKDDHRHLWPEMLRAITEIQPTWVVGENVPGLLNWNRGMVLAEIKADLEAAGFEVFPPVMLPACGKNAPHRRDRLWIVAHAEKANSRNPLHTRSGRDGFTGVRDVGIIANANQFGQTNGYAEPITDKQGFDNRSNSEENDANTESGGLERLGELGETIESGRAICTNERDSENNITHPQRIGQPGSRGTEGQSDSKTFGNGKASWSDDDGKWPTESPVCSRNDGVQPELVGITIPKHSKESIKGYGNSVVPQIVYQIFKTLNQLSCTPPQ